METREIFSRINQLRDNIADLKNLRNQMDAWGFNTDEVWEEEEWSYNEIDRLYGLLEAQV